MVEEELERTEVLPSGAEVAHLFLECCHIHETGYIHG